MDTVLVAAEVRRGVTGRRPVAGVPAAVLRRPGLVAAGCPAATGLTFLPT
ncbi:hypothetical protein ACWKSP_06605 [Micromonosporaceae bacterium Da 78-11]